jgi:hypothetical protein
MPPASARRHRPGFLIYYAYEDEVPVRRRLAVGARRTVTVVTVLVLVTLLSLTLGPAFQS